MGGEREFVMIHGIILGKFYPVHKGHLYLIEEAKKYCDRLTVLCGSIQSELIPGSLRVEWLKQLIKDDKTTAISITDENPQFPEEDPNFWEIWKKSILSRLEFAPNIVFSSENYGERLAQVLGASHLCIDLDRKKVPISASRIREAPLLHWEFIPELIRPYFLKRVVLTGSESVGKSTLAERLANEFKTNWVPEFAREFLESKPSPMTVDDFLPIAEGHLKSEIEASKTANKFLFLDTDHLTTKIYLQHYFHSEDPWITKLAKNLYYDESLFLDIDIPWVADSLRDLGKEREYMKQFFMNEMHLANRSFQMVQGNFKVRESLAIEIVKTLESKPMEPKYFESEQIQLRSFG